MKSWLTMKPKPPEGRKTFGDACAEFVRKRSLSAKSREMYECNLSRYLAS